MGDSVLLQEPVKEVAFVIGDHLHVVSKGVERDGQTGQLTLGAAHFQVTYQAKDFHA